jgi:hypothetical protein
MSDRQRQRNFASSFTATRPKPNAAAKEPVSPPRFLSAIIAYDAAVASGHPCSSYLAGGRRPLPLLDGSLPFSIGQYESN